MVLIGYLTDLDSALFLSPLQEAALLAPCPDAPQVCSVAVFTSGGPSLEQA